MNLAYNHSSNTSGKMTTHKNICELFDYDADNTSEDFETHCTDGSLTLEECRAALIGRGMHYLSINNDSGVERTLRRPEITVKHGIAMIYYFHTKRARNISSGTDSEGKSISKKWIVDNDSTPSSFFASSDDEGEVSSKLLPNNDTPVSKKRMYIELEDRSRHGESRSVDVIKDTIIDLFKFMPSLTPSDAFQQIAREAGLIDTIQYVLRCGKDLECVLTIFREVCLKDVAPVLIKLGYSKTEIKQTAIKIGYDQTDVDNAGLNNNVQLSCLVAIGQSETSKVACGLDKAAATKYARKGKAPVDPQLASDPD